MCQPTLQDTVDLTFDQMSMAYSNPDGRGMFTHHNFGYCQQATMPTQFDKNPTPDPVTGLQDSTFLNPVSATKSNVEGYRCGTTVCNPTKTLENDGGGWKYTRDENEVQACKTACANLGCVWVDPLFPHLDNDFILWKDGPTSWSSTTTPTTGGRSPSAPRS